MAVDEEDPKMNTWFFMCGPLACNIFLLGFACNLFIFQRYELNIERIFDMKSDEVPTPSGVALFGCLLLCIQMLLFGWKQYNPEGDDTFGMKNEIGMESLLVLYALLAACLLSCPLNVFHKKCRFFLLRKIGHCLWPFQFFSFQLPSYPTPFVEVFIADGLTSLSKFFQDTTVALLLLGLTTSTTSYHGMEENLNEMYLTKMKHSPLPYLAASIPYIIRATQCLISYKRTTNSHDRSLHLLNTLKYCSSLLVISVGAFPQLMDKPKNRFHGGDKSIIFLLCAVFNSLYSFLWDVIMDWGLGQPHLPSNIAYLRHQLTYRSKNMYYLIVVCDFILRILWVTKWWDWKNSYGVDFKMVSQIAEVLRRCMWNFLRVEWQCIKMDLVTAKKIPHEYETSHQLNLQKNKMFEEEKDNDHADDDHETKSLLDPKLENDSSSSSSSTTTTCSSTSHHTTSTSRKPINIKVATVPAHKTSSFQLKIPLTASSKNDPNGFNADFFSHTTEAVQRKGSGGSNSSNSSMNNSSRNNSSSCLISHDEDHHTNLS